jgi:hypothetical protein
VSVVRLLKIPHGADGAQFSSQSSLRESEAGVQLNVEG